MAVTKVQDWSTATEGDPSGSPTIGSGSNRLLLLSLNYEWTGTLTVDPPTLTIGGQSYTDVHRLYLDYSGGGDDLYVFLYYWNEAAIAAMSGSAISFSDGEAAAKQAWSVATFAGVNQTTPVTFTDATGEAVTQSAPLSLANLGSTGDYVVISTSARGTQNILWDGNITEQWQVIDSDGGGAAFALAGAAWNTTPHTTYQSVSARVQAASCALLNREGTGVVQQAMYHYRNHGKIF